MKALKLALELSSNGRKEEEEEEEEESAGKSEHKGSNGHIEKKKGSSEEEEEEEGGGEEGPKKRMVLGDSDLLASKNPEGTPFLSFPCLLISLLSLSFLLFLNLQSNLTRARSTVPPP